jgi:hypothetical protein
MREHDSTIFHIIPIKNGTRFSPCPEYEFTAPSQLAWVLEGLFGHSPTRVNKSDMPLLKALESLRFPTLSEAIDALKRHGEIEIWRPWTDRYVRKKKF